MTTPGIDRLENKDLGRARLAEPPVDRDVPEAPPTKSGRGDILAGETYAAWWPFKRVMASSYDEDGPHEFESWAPGWVYVAFGLEDTAPDWQGEGVELRTVVAVFRPGRFPERVFYTRQWRDPAGKVFGKGGLRITTATAFRQWMQGRLKARLAMEMHPWNRTAATAAFEALLAQNALFDLALGRDRAMDRPGAPAQQTSIPEQLGRTNG